MDTLQSNKLNVHDTLIELVNTIEDNEVAISLSSGIDSASILFALLECNKKVHVYSFTLEDRESRDFKVAKELANRYNLEFTPIILSTNIEKLKKDILTLHNKYGCITKTQYECSWPYLYLIPIVKERVIATGIGADSHFVLSKKGILHFKDKPVEFRKEYFSNPNRGQLPQRTQMADECNKILFEPYFSKKMISYLLNSTWDECNKPRQKMPIRRAFPNEFAKMHIYQHTNFQLGDSGISNLFEKLLYTDWNIYNYKSVVGIFNCVNRGEIVRVNNDRPKLI